MTNKKVVGYLAEIDVWDKLIKVNAALYDDKPMTADRRRDIANHLYSLLHDQMVAITDNDLKQVRRLNNLNQ